MHGKVIVLASEDNWQAHQGRNVHCFPEAAFFSGAIPEHDDDNAAVRKALIRKSCSYAQWQTRADDRC